jgi:hypothetical protein
MTTLVTYDKVGDSNEPTLSSPPSGSSAHTGTPPSNQEDGAAAGWRTHPHQLMIERRAVSVVQKKLENEEKKVWAFR